MGGPLKQCGILAATSVGLWLLMVVPAWMVAGSRGVIGLTISAFLCLLPGWAVFLIVGQWGALQSQASAVLVATVLRLVVVLVGAMAVVGVRPDFGLRDFFVWLIIFYTVTLMVETLLLVRKASG